MSTPLSIREDRLRHVWAKQYLQTDVLTTLDGRRLKVIDPGTLNRGSGPDFHDAVIAVDGRTYRGDIEFHRTLADWNAHEHQKDSQYNSVILHVVLHRSSTLRTTTVESGRTIPVLILDQFLSSPLEKILEQTSRAEVLSRNVPIPCFGKNESVPTHIIERWIQTLFSERLMEKTGALRLRLAEIIEEHQNTISEPHKEYGELSEEGNPNEIPLPDFCFERGALNKAVYWEQLLYEGLMDGLGYSSNRLPFRKLAQSVTIHAVKKLKRQTELSLLDIQAILLDVAGLLPPLAHINNQPARLYVHQIHSSLKTVSFVSPEKIYGSEWIFSPTRPSNFPTVRIAAAAQFISKIISSNLVKQIISVFNGDDSSPETRRDQLLSLLDCTEDPFWSFHYSFHETLPRAHAILGATRRKAIIINTVIPFLCLYASVFGKKNIYARASAAALCVDKLEDNAILRRMEKQLVQEKLRVELAFQQQGILQLHERYCSAARCSQCDIGRIVFQ